MSTSLSPEIALARRAAAEAAAAFVQEGMLVGLGTGSTAQFMIEKLSARCRAGLRITAVATSQKSAQLATAGGIPIVDVNRIQSIDLTIDGADEIDPEKRMIKGGGGALLREKILASSSKEMVVIVDQYKLVAHLGKCKLPLEIVPFAFHTTLARLAKLGYQGTLRMQANHSPFMTDNGNYIFDIQLPHPTETPAEHQHRLLEVAGVVDTGFFLNLAGRVVVGYTDGHTEVQ